MSKVEIELEGAGGGKFLVDGHDIARCVRGFQLGWSVGNLNQITLDLVVVDATRVDGDFEIWLDHRTGELLERAGWTPPAAGGRFTLAPASQPMPVGEETA